MTSNEPAFRGATNFKALAIAVALFLGGLVSLWLSSIIAPEVPAQKPSLLGREHFTAVFEQLGALLVGSAVLSGAWELFAKRSFTEEFLEKVGAIRSLDRSGLADYTHNYLQDIQWQQLLPEANEITVFLAWGNGWREPNLPHISNCAAKKGRKIRIALPDRKNDEVVNALAHRFDREPSYVRHEIEKAENDLVELKSGLGQKTTVEVIAVSRATVFTFYVIDTKAILTLYNHRKTDIQVPAFVCDKGGELYGFVEGEVRAIFEDTEIERRELDAPTSS